LKIKCIVLLALMLVMGAFLLPINASALADSEPTEDPPEVQEVSPLPSPVDEPPQSPWAEAPETGNPFTPPGSATVIDNATSDDGKEFFTFATPEGNVFFLVIDRSRGQDNVYFLNAVTEQDLMALAASSGGDTPFAPVPPPLPTPDLDDPAEDIDPPTTVPDTQGGNNGTMIFIAIAALAFGGAAYYLKIVRPKNQGSDFDDEDEYDEEEAFDDDELDEEYDVDEILREYGTGGVQDDSEIDEEEEERLFDEIQ